MMMIGMMLLWIAVIALAVWGFSWLFPSATRNTSLDDADRDPLDILSARYARGEITREEYREIRQDLES